MVWSVGVFALAFTACKNTSTEGGDQNASAATAEGQPAGGTDALKIGDKAPVFELMNVDGTTYSLKDVRDANGKKPKGYIVTFTCNTCPYANGYESRIIALHQKYAAFGYPVVAIQPNDPEAQPGDSFEAMQQRAQEKSYPFLYLFDAEQSVYPSYGATRTPEVFLLDSDFVLRYHGAIDDAPEDPEEATAKYVEAAITAIDAGQMPNPADVKAIGCNIKPKKS